MPKTLLSIQEIKELCKILTEVFSYIKDFKIRNEVAHHIQNPKLPSILTESLAIHLIRGNRIIRELSGFEINFNGIVSDIVATSGESSKLIEIKGTAEKAFQYFSGKDVGADYLVWIHFGSNFTNNNFSVIEIFTIRNPSRYFERPQKITLRKFQNVVDGELEKTTINLSEL